MRLRHLWRLTVPFATACFTEGAQLDGPGDPACPNGTRGCPCFADESCDDGLSCSMGACVMPGCTPGELACNCHDGSMCFNPLVCEGNACHEPADATGTGEASGTTAATTTPGTTEPASTGADETRGASTGMGDCVGEPDCAACRACAAVGPCLDEFGACADDATCTALLACVDACGESDPSCLMDCSLAHEAGIALFMALATCRNCECSAACDSPCG